MSTIFALSSAVGRAGVAIIRISGPEAEKALSALGCKELPKPRVASLRKLSTTEEGETNIIDEAIVIWFPAPNSFSGEDMIELHIHGSHAVISEITSVLSKVDGLRIAEPGEFSRRAFENNKMDLTKAEGIADLIDAETKIQQKQALRQISGELEKLYEDWRKILIAVLARMEAYIDFPDEDIPEEINNEILTQVGALKESLEKHLNNKSGEILRGGIYAAIIGAPNVGKSSLMNYLAKRDVAIVSNIAGTTRDAIEIHLDIAGYPLIICDTAGLRESQDEIESEGIKRAIKKAENADLKICLFDASDLPDIDQSTLKVVDDDSIAIINKTDLNKSSQDIKIKELNPIPISVKTGEGMDTLLEKIEEKLSNKILPSNEPVLTRQRHRTNLEETTEHLSRFLETRQESIDIELSAENLRLAARSLGKITGRIDVEDLLDEIFSSFCIGK